MYDYLILAEKPSAAASFAKALGGKTGTYNGHSYKIVNSFGHILTLAEPEKMVAKDLQDKYGSWAVDSMPWKHTDFKWKRVPIVGINPRTKRKESMSKTIASIKAEASKASAIVIATDNDPSGEGELIGWEIIEAIGWHKKVLRVFFDDPSVNSLQKAMKSLVDISDISKDGDYVKAYARNRWDFLSMQLTRIATSSARNAGYNVSVIKQGRLKSVMTRHVYEQLQAIKNYVRVPYFEVKFNDGNDHIFSRKVSEDETAGVRFADKQAGLQDLSKFKDSAVVDMVKKRKTSGPAKLLSLSGLASILGKKGYSSKEILATYQKLYEAEYVSYPRTEDKTITPEQFNEMLPIINDIANVVNVDTSLLTHKSPRKSHVVNKGAHGANRPGLKVPKSLNELSKFGASAVDIYEVLSKNFLAMFGEDYEYDSVVAHLEKYPKFVTHFNIPVALNYKLIFSNDSDDNEDKNSTKPLNSKASPYLYEGANKKPTKPTTKWLYTFLTKNGVGTGATQVSTFADISNGKKALLTEKNSALGITPLGEVSAIMAENTFISSVKITKQLFDAMDKAGKFEISSDKILDTAIQVVNHDLPIFEKNATMLKTLLGEPKGKLKMSARKPKVEGIFVPKGISVTFNKKWSTHEFTKKEIDALLAGKEITFDYVAAGGKHYGATGKLERQSYNGNSFWGFKNNSYKK